MLRVDHGHVQLILPRYRAVDPAHLRVEEADGIRVVYDRRSGQTHLMAPDLAAVFDALAEGAADSPAILTALSRDAMVEVERGDPLDSIAARLEELAGLALADRLA